MVCDNERCVQRRRLWIYRWGSEWKQRPQFLFELLSKVSEQFSNDGFILIETPTFQFYFNKKLNLWCKRYIQSKHMSMIHLLFLGDHSYLCNLTGNKMVAYTTLFHLCFFNRQTYFPINIAQSWCHLWKQFDCCVCFGPQPMFGGIDIALKTMMESFYLSLQSTDSLPIKTKTETFFHFIFLSFLFFRIDLKKKRKFVDRGRERGKAKTNFSSSFILSIVIYSLISFENYLLQFFT